MKTNKKVQTNSVQKSEKENAVKVTASVNKDKVKRQIAHLSAES